MDTDNKYLLIKKQNIIQGIISKIKEKFFKFKNKKIENKTYTESNSLDTVPKDINMPPKVEEALEMKLANYKNKYTSLLNLKKQKQNELERIKIKELQVALKIYMIEENYLRIVKEEKIEKLKQLKSCKG